MDVVFDAFKKAWDEGNGYAVAETLSPIAPSSNPERLRNFYRSTNIVKARNEIGNQIFYGTSFSDEEGNGWLEVYFSYWKAVGEILNAENAAKANTKVGLSFSQILSVKITSNCDSN